MEENNIRLVPFTCPACKGVLEDVGNKIYQCPVDHVYSLQELINSQYQTIDSLLWALARIMEERKLAILLLLEQEPVLSSLFKQQAAASQQAADNVRGLLQHYE